ncbi:pre-mRNA-processing factor 19-like isoform X3 [Apium graveolens]|uniref:pre-mRNA-processing factor 19-like isoform X3 n=1 Tax=Apium graveolens TaxID=4045 RepID=UPI003D79EB89
MILTMITAGSIFSLLVTSVKFVNKGELVVTGSGDNTVHVWKRSEKGSYKCKDIVDHHTAEVSATNGINYQLHKHCCNNPSYT